MAFKNNYSFPYHDYPYNMKDKCWYYGGNIICQSLSIIGVNLYGKFFCKTTHLSNDDIADKKSIDLTILINQSKKYGIWHLKGFGISSGMLAVTLFMQKFQNNIPDTSYKCGLICFTTGAINHFYGMMLHTFNIIRYSQQVDIINHGINIARAVKAASAEVYAAFDVDNNLHNKESLEDLIHQNIYKKKTTWHLSEYVNNEIENVYIIYNDYYETLFFVFNIETTANEFLNELQFLNNTQVDSLYKNPTAAINLQKQFIKNKIYCTMFQKYYTK